MSQYLTDSLYPSPLRAGDFPAVSGNSLNYVTAENSTRWREGSGKQTTDIMAPQPFKVVLLGESNVGKTSLFLRVKTGTFRNPTTVTTGIESYSTSLQIAAGSTVQLVLFDTAGLERFRTLTRNYYRNAHAVLLVYSVDNPSSLFYLARWAQDATEHAPTAQKFLIGNKCDLENSVLDGTVQDFASAQGCEMAGLISAKTGAGVNATLEKIAEVLHKASCKQSVSTSGSWLVDTPLTILKEQEPKASCC